MDVRLVPILPDKVLENLGWFIGSMLRVHPDCLISIRNIANDRGISLNVYVSRDKRRYGTQISISSYGCYEMADDRYYWEAQLQSVLSSLHSEISEDKPCEKEETDLS